MRRTDKKYLHRIAIVIIPLILFFWALKVYADYSEDVEVRRLMGQRISYYKTNDLENRLQVYKAASDFKHPITRKFALNLASRNAGSYNLRQVFTIYDEVLNKWQYVNDPSSAELIAKASFSIETGLKGDCDDFAVTLSSLIQAIGGKTRIVNGFKKNASHAYTELFIGDLSKKQEASYLIHKRYGRNYPKGLIIHYSQDSTGNYWLNLDWNTKHPGGKYFEATKQLIFYTSEGKYELKKK
jgi:hypothetical protein